MFIDFFFNDTATAEIYTLSLHDALPILQHLRRRVVERGHAVVVVAEGAGQEHVEGEAPGTDASGNVRFGDIGRLDRKSTRELQSRQYLVCRLLLEKKKKTHCLITLMP